MTVADQPNPQLERRYRRLMASYPQSFRIVYEEEMISVAMSASTPGRARPTVRETVGMIGSGLIMRGRRAARHLVTEMRGEVWADGATAYAFIAAATITALHGFQVAEDATSRSLAGYAPISREATALTIGWALVIIALVLRWRRTAAVGAALGVVGQAVAMGVQYDRSPSSFVTQWWHLVLAMSAAVAAGIAVHKQGAADPMPRRSMIAILVAGALAVLAGPADAWFAAGDRSPNESGRPRFDIGLPGYHPMNAIRLAFLATAAAIGLIVVLRLAGPVRRHVIALAAPVIVTAVGIAEGFRGFLNSSPAFSPAVQLAAGQWIALILGPIVVLLLAALVVDRHEQRLELIRLGRRAAG